MTTEYDESRIERIALGLIDHDFPKTEWTHAAHFAAALWLLRHRPELVAPDAVRRLISRYNEATDTPNTDDGGYHHSITLASMRAASAHLRRHPGEMALAPILADLLASQLGKSTWPLAYWSREALFSVEARRLWVDPDLAPLPF